MEESESSSQPNGLSELFSRDTLERKALQADVLSRMFGSVEPGVQQRVGRYEVVRKLGAGGMGVVYLARDPELDRRVAIKLLRRRVREADTRDTEARLRSEARAMARVNHAHVVHVHDVGRYGEQLFIAMEYVEGSTLTGWLQGSRSWSECLRAFIDAGEGLAAAHEADLVHRDFKPDNVLLGEDGVVKVTDFGIAVAMDPWESTVDANPEPSDGPSTPSVAGTLRYMSPEQLRGQALDARSDQFSFCVALYEALTGQHPFAHEHPGALLTAIMTAKPSTSVPRGVPRWVLAAVERGMSPKLGDRWPSMRVLLDRLRDDPRVRRRRIVGAAAALGLVAGAFVVGRGATPAAEDPCAAGSARARSLWSDEQRTAVREQFVQQGLGFGQSSGEATVAALDGWMEQWGAHYAELCRSRHERSDERYEVRMSCLGQQLSKAAAEVELLATADASLVAIAPQLVEGLPDSGACVHGPLEIEPPPAEVAAEVARVRERLAQLDAALEFRRPDAVGDELEAMREQAQSLGYRPLVAEIARVQVTEADLRGDRPRVSELARLAYGVGLETKHDGLALEAAVFRLSADIEDEATPSSERLREHLNDTARHLSARLGFPAGPEAMRRQSYIEALWSHGRSAEAIAQLEQAVARILEVDEADALSSIGVLTMQARYLAQSMQLQASLSVVDRIEALLERKLGREHPLNAEPLLVRAEVYLMMGRYDEALTQAQRSLALQEVINGPRHRLVRYAWQHIASIHDMRGEHEQARAAYERLLGEPVPRGPDLSPRNVEYANSYCYVLYRLGEYERAVDTCEQARSACRRYWPEGSASEAIVLNNLALVARAQGRFEDSLALDQQALTMCEGLDEVRDRAIVYSWIGVGESLLALSRPADAIEPLARALRVRAERVPDSPEQGEAECLLGRARLEARRGDPEEARTLAERGLARLRAGGAGWKQTAEACRDGLGARLGGSAATP